MGSVLCNHAVQFYGSDERHLVKTVSEYLGEGLNQGENVLCIATLQHRSAVLRHLRVTGAATAPDRLILADAAQTMSGFMRDGQPDPDLFRETIAPLADRIALSGNGGRAYGEMVGLLWESGQLDAAVRLEQLWNDLLHESGLSLLCGYPIDVFTPDFQGPEIEAILSNHSTVISAGKTGEIREAIERSARELMADAFTEQMINSAHPSPGTALPCGESAILALRKSHPERAPEVLAIARRHYGAQRRFRALIENSSEGFALLDRNGLVIYASPSIQKILGYGITDLHGRNFLHLANPENLEFIHSQWSRNRADPDSQVILEFRMRHADGRWIWIEGTLSNRFDDPDLQAQVFNFRDISRRKEDEEALRASERRLAARERYLATMLDCLPECVKVLDRDGVVLQMNRSGLAMVEADAPDDVLGKCVYPIIEESSRDAFSALNASVFEGGSGGTLEFSIEGLKGSRRTFETRVGPLLGEDHQVVGALSATRDITERKKFEEKMRETAKLESLGLLAGGIAHDFNNLLTGILGSASLLQEEVPRHSSLYPSIDTIARASERAADLTRQMLAYSGRGHFIVEPLNLALQVQENLSFLKASLPKHVHLVSHLENAGVVIQADAGQIQQVLMNLIINAAEATLSEDSVSVAVRPLRLEAPKSTATTELLPGNYVELEVRDNGIGMDESTKQKIFDPFFTTKFTGRGLGLAAVLGILRGHKAGLEVQSAPGCGSVFKVYFRAAECQLSRNGKHPSMAGRNTEQSFWSTMKNWYCGPGSLPWNG